MTVPLIIRRLNNSDILFINCHINGVKSTLLFDTGASISIIDKRKIFKFTSDNLKKSDGVTSISDNVDTYTVKISEFKIGDISMSDIYFNAVDLLNLNNLLSTNYVNVVDGILGNDIILKSIETVNFNDMTVTLKNT